MTPLTPKAIKVLTVLHAAGPVGATTGLLCRGTIGGARFGGRIFELRDAGCVIDKAHVKDNQYRYWLRHTPESLKELLGLRPAAEPTPRATGPLNPHAPHRDGCPALAAGDTVGRVPGVLGTSLCTCAPCECDGCLQRAAGSALGDHVLAMQVPAATAIGARSLASRSSSLPVLGMVA